MGSGVMQCLINGPATSGIDDKIKMAIFLSIAAYRGSVKQEDDVTLVVAKMTG